MIHDDNILLELITLFKTILPISIKYYDEYPELKQKAIPIKNRLSIMSIDESHILMISNKEKIELSSKISEYTNTVIQLNKDNHNYN